MDDKEVHGTEQTDTVVFSDAEVINPKDMDYQNSVNIIREEL